MINSNQMNDTLINLTSQQEKLKKFLCCNIHKLIHSDVSEEIEALLKSHNKLSEEFIKDRTKSIVARVPKIIDKLNACSDCVNETDREQTKNITHHIKSLSNDGLKEYIKNNREKAKKLARPVKKNFRYIYHSLVLTDKLKPLKYRLKHFFEENNIDVSYCEMHILDVAFYSVSWIKQHGIYNKKSMIIDYMEEILGFNIINQHKYIEKFENLIFTKVVDGELLSINAVTLINMFSYVRNLLINDFKILKIEETNGTSSYNKKVFFTSVIKEDSLLMKKLNLIKTLNPNSARLSFKHLLFNHFKDFDIQNTLQEEENILFQHEQGHNEDYYSNFCRSQEERYKNIGEDNKQIMHKVDLIRALLKNYLKSNKLKFGNDNFIIYGNETIKKHYQLLIIASRHMLKNDAREEWRNLFDFSFKELENFAKQQYFANREYKIQSYNHQHKYNKLKQFKYGKYRK